MKRFEDENEWILKEVLIEFGMNWVVGVDEGKNRIKNNFFGESITVAGLLTGKDVLEQLREASEKGELGETLLLPKVMLKADEDIFLDDMTPNELSEALGVKIEFVGNDGAELLNTLIGRCENP